MQVVKALKLRKELRHSRNTKATQKTLIFFKLGFTLCKAEQPLQYMELQGKKAQKD